MEKLILGTAQFGQKYGITNPDTMISKAETFEILRAANSAGIREFDTAFGYGDSQKLLGEAITEGIVTRPKLISKYGFRQQLKQPDEFLDELKATLEILNVESFEGLLLHDPKDFEFASAWDCILEARSSGMVKKIGISGYGPDDILSCSYLNEINLIQIPVHLLDHRWQQPEWVELMRHDSIEVHVRSVFLQGLLLAEADRWPSFFQEDAQKLNSWMGEYSQSSGLSRLQMCLKFVNDLDWVDKMVTGVYCLEQLNELTSAMESLDQVSPEAIAIPFHPSENLLDPRKWS